MKNNYLVIGLIVIVVLLLAGGGFYFVAGSKDNKQSPEPTPPVEEIVPTISPEKLGLTVSARTDGKAVMFEIANAEGIAGIDYEISYEAEGGIPRGAIGHLDGPQAGESSVETNYIELGSCSSGRCKYDEGVTSVKFTLKITMDNGDVFQAEKTLDLE